MFGEIPILTRDAYRGFSVSLASSGVMATGAQPVFVGRIVWPGSQRTEDYVIKPYQPTTCGIANEVIGYMANTFRRIAQPKKAAILLLPPESLSGLEFDLVNFVEQSSGLVACWVTSFEQGAKPFKYIRRLPSFSKKQVKAFFSSKFCTALTTVDHVTGNSDRHDGNYLYVDDLHYLAIDQGCVAGGIYWHINQPDKLAQNALIADARSMLSSSEISAWISSALLEHGKTQESWRDILPSISHALKGLLDQDSIQVIVKYMSDRASGEAFAQSCGQLV